MKLFLSVLLLTSSIASNSFAEGNNPETKPESDISSSTKKVLRKIGRKSMDTTCELTKSKIECDKEKAENAALTKSDEADTQKRKMMKEQKKITKAEALENKKAAQKIEEKNCHNQKGKIPCAADKVKNSVKNAVE